jgi:hypothetical protein
MQVQNISHMFSFAFEKSTTEIIGACRQKESALRTKIEEREGRVSRVRAEYKITDSVLIDLLSQARAASKRNDALMNYSSSVPGQNESGEPVQVTVGAGVVNMLLTERDFIDGEKAQADKLSVIARNLRDYTDERGIVRTSHRLGYDELRFLGL